MTCDKFEQLFISESQNELLKHIEIQNCEDCRAEYKKMLITEQIIKEAKPYYRNKKRMYSFALKSVASFALLVVCSTVLFQNSYNNTNFGFVTKISYEDAVSAGLPIDEYGLLDIQ